MRKNAIHTVMCAAAFLAVVLLSDPETDLTVDRATAADVQDAITTAQQVAVAHQKGSEE